MKVVILGAGITGLAAAVNLLTGGHDITLLEKNDRVGGLAATLNWKNHVLDYGAFICYPQLKALLPEPVNNAMDWRTVSQMSAQIYLDQGLVDWPFTPSDIYRRLGLMGSAAAFLDMMTAGWKPYRRGKSENARDFIIKKIGKRLMRYSHIEEEILKLTGHPGCQLSPQFVIDHLFRFAQISPKHLILNRFRRIKAPSLIHYPEYPRGGISCIPFELEKFLTSKGVKTRKSVTIHRIIGSGKWVNEVIFSQDGVKQRLNADFIISTIPLTRTLQLLGKDKPALTGKIPFRHMLLLYLLVRKPSVTGRQLTYAFSERIPFKRLVEFKHYDDRGIPPEQTGIAAEICYTHKEEIQDKPGIYSRVIGNLREMGLMEEEDIIDHCYRISHYAYPVEALGYEKAREEILEEITFDNMISCGRQGISRYCQMPFAYKMGTAAAAHINDRIFNKDRHLELCYDFSYRKNISGE